MGVVVIAVVCGFATVCITKALHKKFPMKEYFFTRECLWFAIFAMLFLSSLFAINPTAPDGSATVIESAPAPRGEIVGNSLAIFALLPILLAIAYTFDKILIRVRRALERKK